MVIPVRAADTPFQSSAFPVVVSRLNIFPLSFAAFRDRDLVNNLGRFAALHKLQLDTTYLTNSLLYLLLTYRATYKPTGPAAIRCQNAIQILETAWKADIKAYSEDADFTPEDPSTGEVIWNTIFVRFINLILQPLRTRSAYIFFDEMGDISGQLNGAGIWRQC